MTTATTERSPALRLYSGLLGIAGLVIIGQGLWAGLFVREGEGYEEKWVEWHARGADLAIVLVLAATVVGAVKLRARKDLWGGSLVLLVLLAVEAYLGGRSADNGDQDLTTVHIPLAMAIVAVAVFVATRAGAGRHIPD